MSIHKAGLHSKLSQCSQDFLYMASDYFRKLSTRLFSPLVFILVFVLIVLIMYVPNVTKNTQLTPPYLQPKAQ